LPLLCSGLGSTRMYAVCMKQHGTRYPYPWCYYESNYKRKI
jgi:hypothetical protein